MAGDTLDIDLASPAFMRDPFPVLTRLREAGPVVRVKLPLLGKSWIATTHEAVSDVLKDDGAFVRSPKNAGKRQFAGMRWWMPRTLRVLGENMLGHDDPDHRRLRKLVDQAFNRQSVAGLRGRIGGICDDLLGRMASNGPVDLMEGLARPLPLAVICELLVGYFKRHLAGCRRQPRPGLMTALVQAEQDGDKLSENELLAMAFLLLVAGHETTVHLIGGGVLALLEAAEQKARLPADWSLVPSAVEELLRFVSPVQVAKPRYVRRDLELHGRPLLRGEVLIPMLASANADPARFESPERMDLSRAPNPHVAFGTGMHFCLGAQLARVEAQVVLGKLFTRFPNLSLAVPGPALKYTGRLGIRALTALPVRLT
jgi:cytochrome P450